MHRYDVQHFMYCIFRLQIHDRPEPFNQNHILSTWDASVVVVVVAVFVGDADADAYNFIWHAK